MIELTTAKSRRAIFKLKLDPEKGDETPDEEWGGEEGVDLLPSHVKAV